MDAKQLISDLVASGMRIGQIGPAVGRTQPWAGMVVSGEIKDIKSSAAEKLRVLHAARCQQAAA